MSQPEHPYPDFDEIIENTLDDSMIKPNKIGYYIWTFIFLSISLLLIYFSLFELGISFKAWFENPVAFAPFIAILRIIYVVILEVNYFSSWNNNYLRKWMIFSFPYEMLLLIVVFFIGMSNMPM